MRDNKGAVVAMELEVQREMGQCRDTNKEKRTDPEKQRTKRSWEI